MKGDSRDTKIVLWVNRIIRWGLGITFLSIGILYKDEGRWFAIVFGVALIATGFFRPKRCLEEGSCELNNN